MLMINPEFRLLLLSCRLDDTHKAAADAQIIINENKIDWEEVYDRAYCHCVEPQLLTLLTQLPSSLFPSDFMERLKGIVQGNLARQLRYVAEFFQISDWLEREDIAVIPYKGFWLAESMYGSLADRVSYDMDLFIDHDDLEKVKRIMTGRGYSGHESLEELTDEYIHNELAEYNFDRYEDGVRMSHVEFHWRSSMSFYRMGINLNDLRPQIIKSMLQGREVTAFSPAANLLLAVMHHGGKECFIQLRQILDIAHIIRRHPDIDTKWLLEQCDRFHVSTLLLLGIRLASELTGVKIPPALEACSNNNRIKRLAAGRIRLMSGSAEKLLRYKETLSSWIFKIRSREGLGTKMNLLKYTLRKIIAPGLIPVRWRHLFFDRKIRRSTHVSEGG